MSSNVQRRLLDAVKRVDLGRHSELPGRHRRLPVAGVLVIAVGAMGGCVSDDHDADYLYEQADAYRGGNLWDKWWQVPDIKEGIEPGATVTLDDVGGSPNEVKSSLPADNPLYKNNSKGNKRSGSQTWRCKECHGWDTKGKDGAYGSGGHASGFPGVWAARDKSPSELFNAIKKGGKGHNFGTVLSDADIADAVKFIREGAVDPTPYVTKDKKPIGADLAAGQTLFEDSCGNSSCHGSDGRNLNFASGYASEYVFNVASDNPWELMHKVRFGQPNGEMPNGSVKGYVMKDVVDILAYVQSLAPAGLEEASIQRGGVLWDEWWVVNGAPEPAGTNPLYKDTTYNTLGGGKSGGDTWRCKECHGWDYKGVDGAYGGGSHATGIKGVFGSQDLPAADLIAAIAEGKMPRGGPALAKHAFLGDGKLSEGDVKDLVLFIKEGLVDDVDYISYVTKRSKGSAAVGAGLFNGNCGRCHGNDGLVVNFKHENDEGTEYVADVARDNPFELTHKVRFGQPGSDEHAAEIEEERGIFSGQMPNKFDAGYSEEDVANIVAYAQTLPGSAERGGTAWDVWWETSGVAEAIEPGGKTTLEDGTEQASSLAATNPTYKSNPEANDRDGPDTWRCKECHGWDYKGADGVYGSGGHKTGFPGVWDMRDADYAVLHDAIADGKFAGGGSDRNHAFGAVLGEDVVRDLVTFIGGALSGGTFDYGRELIAPDKSVLMDYVPYDETDHPEGMKARTRDAIVLLGQIKFNGSCANCHGSDGRRINFHEGEGEEEYVSTVAKDNPWEITHKIISGQPGSSPRMPNAAGVGYTADDLADILAYVQLLP